MPISLCIIYSQGDLDQIILPFISFLKQSLLHGMASLSKHTYRDVSPHKNLQTIFHITYDDLL